MAPPPPPLDAHGRRLVLLAGFGAWMLSGVQMGFGPLLARPSLRDLLFAGATALSPDQESVVLRLIAALFAAFLLGAAFGGLIFGWAGDRYGRVNALAASVACFSLFTAAQAFAQTPGQLIALRFLASLGMGGTWPNAVALVGEAWPAASRPVLAGVMGAAANVGILFAAVAGGVFGVGVQTWRLTSLLSGLPLLLAAAVPFSIPESPRWLAVRHDAPAPPSESLFRPPLLWRTLIGILLGTIPLVGTWSAGKWIIPWAGTVLGTTRAAAVTQAWWASGAVLGSLFGGWVADAAGRRATYFTVSLVTLLVNISLYRFLVPSDASFLPAVFGLGLVATVFYGWLPLYLPELFPTRVRATGAGVAFNFGRFVSAPVVLLAAMLLGEPTPDIYPRVGEAMAWVYGLGMVVILFAPDTSKEMEG